MKKKSLPMLSCLLLLALLCGCGQGAPAKAQPGPTPAPSLAVADASQMTTVEEVVEEGMVPVYGESLLDGSYAVQVDCSSSMFRITDCTLRVSGGKMEAVLTMSSDSYLYVYPGSAMEAAEADRAAYIPCEESAEGGHSFTLPVEALDAGTACAAFSKNKELWYDRTLVFRADSLPAEAFREGFFTTAESLQLADGSYTAAVTLSGGSGKASVSSPARLWVEQGQCTAEIVWGSKNYDYMRLGEERFLPVNTEGNSTFLIPVAFFDRPMTMVADTVAMSEPHEIEYRLTFDSASLEAAS